MLTSFVAADVFPAMRANLVTALLFADIHSLSSCCPSFSHLTISCIPDLDVRYFPVSGPGEVSHSLLVDFRIVRTEEGKQLHVRQFWSIKFSSFNFRNDDVLNIGQHSHIRKRKKYIIVSTIPQVCQNLDSSDCTSLLQSQKR